MSEVDAIFSGYSEEFIEVAHDYGQADINIAHVTGQLNETLAILNAPHAVMNEARCWGSTLLPGAIAARLSTRDQVTVIDFGGGAAKQYAEIYKAVPEHLFRKIAYHVLETPQFCALARPHLQSLLSSVWDKRFFLHSEGVPPAADIISCTSSLHYVKDYRQQFAELLSTGPEAFLIINTPINDRHTYSRVQHNLATPIAQWVFSIGMLDELFTRSGYERAFFARHQLDYPTRDTPAGSQTAFCSAIYQRPS